MILSRFLHPHGLEVCDCHLIARHFFLIGIKIKLIQLFYIFLNLINQEREVAAPAVHTQTSPSHFRSMVTTSCFIITSYFKIMSKR